MKRGSVFLLGFAIVLFILPIICLVFRLSAINQIALAATIGGCCFAISDVCFFYADEWGKEVSHEEEKRKENRVFIQKTLPLLNKVEEQINKTLEIDKKTNKSLVSKTVNLFKFGSQKAVFFFLRKKIHRENRLLRKNYAQVKTKRLNTWGSVFIVLGVVLSFISSIIPLFAEYIDNTQLYITVYGFSLVVFLYYARETSKQRIKKRKERYLNWRSNIKIILETIPKLEEALKHIESAYEELTNQNEPIVAKSSDKE